MKSISFYRYYELSCTTLRKVMITLEKVQLPPNFLLRCGFVVLWLLFTCVAFSTYRFISEHVIEYEEYVAKTRRYLH